MKKNKNHNASFLQAKGYQLKAGTGFTLIELLLYIAISSILLLALSIFLSTLIQARIKNQTIMEVENQGLLVMRQITQTIRNAEAITVPAEGSNASSLTLDVITVAQDPTMFDVSGGVIQVTEGAAAPIALTNSRVTVSSLTFYNLSRTGTPGTIRIQLVLAYVNPSGRNEYSYQKSFFGTATLRQP